jgi:hypothetical protein
MNSHSKHISDLVLDDFNDNDIWVIRKAAIGQVLPFSELDISLDDESIDTIVVRCGLTFNDGSSQPVIAYVYPHNKKAYLIKVFKEERRYVYSFKNIYKLWEFSNPLMDFVGKTKEETFPFKLGAEIKSVDLKLDQVVDYPPEYFKEFRGLELEDFDEHKIWIWYDEDDYIVTPDINNLEEYPSYDEYMAKGLVRLNDGTELETIAGINGDDNSVYPLWLFLGESSYELSFYELKNSEKELGYLEKYLGKKRDDIFPMEMKVKVDIPKVDIVQMKKYPDQKKSEHNEPDKKGIGKYEAVFIINLVLLLTALMLTQIMTFNRFTGIGLAAFYILLALWLVFMFVGFQFRKFVVVKLCMGVSILMLLLCVLLQFSSPQPQKGIFFDTTKAWEKYQR